jgi:hypothetical protein
LARVMTPSVIDTERGSYFIGDGERKVRMTKSLPDSYTLSRIEGKQFLNEIQKLPINDVGRRYNILWRKETISVMEDKRSLKDRPIANE